MVRKINTSYKLGAMLSRAKFALMVFFIFCAGNAAAQSVEEEKERAVVEVGASASHTVTGDGANSFGPSVAVEITPVKHWLPFPMMDRFAVNTPHLYSNLEDRWLTPRLIEMNLDEEGMCWHSFKRCRKT